MAGILQMLAGLVYGGPSLFIAIAMPDLFLIAGLTAAEWFVHLIGGVVLFAFGIPTLRGARWSLLAGAILSAAVVGEQLVATIGRRPSTWWVPAVLAGVTVVVSGWAEWTTREGPRSHGPSS